MALRQSPSIVTNGLIFYYDMNNREKSWIGAPATNLVSLANTNDLNGAFAKAASTTFTAAEIPLPAQVRKFSGTRTSADTVYNAGGWIAHTATGGVSSGQQIMCSMYVKGISTYSVTWTWGGSHTGNASTFTVDLKTGAASGVTMVGSETYSIENVGDGWWRLACSTTLTGAACYPQINYAGVIAVCGTQFEVGNRVTRYLIGSRSNTQALLNLTSQSTITTTSLTYSNDGTFSFNGSSNLLDCGAQSGPFALFTVSTWFNASNVANFKNVIDCNFSYNATTGNIGPRLEMNSSGNLVWVISGNTGNNSINDNYTVISSGMQANRWYNVVITRNGSTISTYLNGDPVSSNAANPNGFVNVFNNVVIGRGFHLDSAANRSFQGQISAVKIYNRALNSSEVTQNFNALRSRYGI